VISPYLVCAAALLVVTVAGTASAQSTSLALGDSATVAPRRASSWTSDRRSFAVGDIIKVEVDEYALARAHKDNTSSASRSRTMSVGIDPPSAGGASPGNVSGSVGTGDAGQSTQRGNATRDTRYLGEIAVRVVAITPEGLLQVQGTKTIDVDRNQQTLTLSGYVRPIDIGARDVVRSEFIADAQIAYQSKGSLGKPRNGILTKIIGIFWP
jgi:flagellar L-ring protein FlgH